MRWGGSGGDEGRETHLMSGATKLVKRENAADEKKNLDDF